MSTQTTDTVPRILETAWALIKARGINNVTIAEIASEAGVSRQLIYFHFTNRAGLLVAMARHQDSQSGFRRRVMSSLRLPVEETLPSLLELWLDYIPEVFPVARALEAAWITGDDGAEAWGDRMNELRETFQFAIKRIQASGRLADGWTVETATDWVWAQSQIDTWSYLVIERGWSHQDVKERMLSSILGEILRPSGTT